jgi:hypothetical protein
MRAAVAGCFAAIMVALAGCGGAGGAPSPAVSTHRAATAAPSLELTPSPGSVTPLVSKTTANRAVCWHFVRARITEAAARRFRVWLDSGPGHEFAAGASRTLISDIRAWYRDSYSKSGRPARVGADLAAAGADCRSIGIFGPG